MLRKEIKNLEAKIQAADNKAGFINDIDRLANQIINDYDFLNAYRLAKVADIIVNQGDKNVSAIDLNKINSLSIKLKFLSLVRWSEPVIVSLFENGIGQVFNDENIDVADRLNALLIETPFDLRDELKQKLLRRLRANKELISDKSIILDGKPQLASISNVLTDYLSSHGDSIPSNIEFAEYFMQSKTFKEFTLSEKEKVKKLLKVFDLLSKSSYNPVGFENVILFIDKDGTLKTLDHGIIMSALGEKTVKFHKRSSAITLPEEISLPQEKEDLSKFITTQTEVKSNVEQEVLAAYQGDPRQLKAVASEQEKVTKKFGNDKAKLRVEFFTAVQNKNIVRTIAILRILAGLADLENFIKEDEKLNKFLAVTWAKRYGDEFVAEFAKNPAQIQFIRLFLRYVLEERLGLSASDAARVGLQIANIFVSLGKIDYNKMAYFDVGKKSFEWFEG
ncbi:MAG: hypothetical protein WC768_04875 [Patescibacteria group bacterium]|jgi:hypothetical protein